MLSESVRTLQEKLYAASKTNPERRFHSLHDKVCRWDVLQQAWTEVRENKGAPGVDGRTIEDVEKQGVDAFLRVLQEDLRLGTYCTSPVRRVLIPKSSGGERALGIPTVRDRVAQAAAKLVLEPVFEATFLDCSYGYRPKRSPHDAARAVYKWLNFGLEYVVDADIHACFDMIPHDRLIEAVAERVSDGSVLRLIRQWLQSGVMMGRMFHETEAGTPQGGVISPLLCNVYLHRLDSEWARRGLTKRNGANAQLVRFADDIVVLSDKPVERVLEELRSILSEMGLSLSEKKTRLVRAEEGFDFLGFRFVRSPSKATGRKATYYFPSPRSVTRVKEKIRGKCSTHTLHRTPEEVVEDLNRLLVGWREYFRHSNAFMAFSVVEGYLLDRFRRFLRRREGKRGAGRYRDLPNGVLFGELGLARMKSWGTVHHASKDAA